MEQRNSNALSCSSVSQEGLDLPVTLLYGLKSDAAQTSRESTEMGPMGRMVMSHATVGRKDDDKAPEVQRALPGDGDCRWG